jgi:hypothetical protein
VCCTASDHRSWPQEGLKIADLGPKMAVDLPKKAPNRGHMAPNIVLNFVLSAKMAPQAHRSFEEAWF